MPKIVNKLKSFVNRTGRKIFKSKGEPLGVQAAKDIQKLEYDTSTAKRPSNYTPPYMELIKQLDVENEQVFRAVVYNLTKIALSSEGYRPDILKSLEEHHSKNSRSRELMGYLAIKISKITNAE